MVCEPHATTTCGAHSPRICFSPATAFQSENSLRPLASGTNVACSAPRSVKLRTSAPLNSGATTKTLRPRVRASPIRTSRNCRRGVPGEQTTAFRCAASTVTVAGIAMSVQGPRRRRPYGRRSVLARRHRRGGAVTFDVAQEHGVHGVEVALVHRRLEHLELSRQLVGRLERLIRAPNARMLGRLGVGTYEQLLVELLAGAQAGIGDGNVTVGVLSASHLVAG